MWWYARTCTVRSGKLAPSQKDGFRLFNDVGCKVWRLLGSAACVVAAAWSLWPELAWNDTFARIPRSEVQVQSKGRSAVWRTHVLENEALALCNDGSKPVIEYSPGGGGYIVMLEGGGQCSTLPCLKLRPLRLKSTNGTKDGSQGSDYNGILSRNPSVNPLAEFSTVFVRYCSSDGWHGDLSDVWSQVEFREANITQGEWHQYKHFRGARIVDAVFRLLTDPEREVERKSLSLEVLSSATPVLFGGFSAGARGAMVNADAIRTRFRLNRFHTWLDSGYYVDMGPTSHLVMQTEDIFSRFVRGSALAVENRVASWMDLFGQYRVPQIVSPMFVIASQLDTFQEGENYDGFTPPEVMHKKVAATIADGIRSMKPASKCAVLISDRTHDHAQTAQDKGIELPGAPALSMFHTIDAFMRPDCSPLVRFVRSDDSQRQTLAPLVGILS